MKQISKKTITRDEFLLAFSSANNHSITLTANQRQARYLSAIISEKNPSARAKPAILSVQQWIDQLWQIYEDQCGAKSDSELLDTIEERSIWRELIASSTQLPILIDTESLVDKLMSAADLAEAYGVPLDDLGRFASVETQFFLSVLLEFNALSEERLFICRRDLPKILKEHSTFELAFPAIDAYGFIDIAPNLQYLFKRLSNEVNLLSFESEMKVQEPCISEFKQTEDELNAIAAWCKQRLAKSENETVAIVVPQLSALKSKIDSVLMQYLEANRYYDLTATPFSELYDISAADKLGGTQLINSLFCALELRKPTISKETAKQLCTSPFIKPAADDACLRVVQWIDNNVANQLRVSTLLTKLQAQSDFDQNPESVQSLGLTDTEAYSRTTSFLALRQAFRTESKARNNRQWCDWLIEKLDLIGWPGDRLLNSLEYQQIQQFIEILQKHKISNVYNAKGQKNISLESFISGLKDRLDNSDFHQQIVKPKIHVLGLMEASGLQFDHCWVMGFSSAEIPSNPSPNVFLPASIQSQFEMPRSNAAREQEYAEQLILDLVRNNKNIQFSYASGESGNECELSPILRKLQPEWNIQVIEPLTIEKSEPLEFIQQQIATVASNFKPFDTLATGNTEAIKQGATIPGGSGHLSLFQTNPYYAFVRYRLGIIPPLTLDEGVNPADYGSILHDVLNNIYAQNNDSEKLQKFLQSDCFENELRQLCLNSILSSLKGDKQKQPLVLQELSQRLQQHLKDFFALELSRTQGFKVSALEQSSTINVLNRKLKIRIDRVDLIDDAELVIDYKSGMTKHQSFLSSPPQDYQLPLYAFSMSANNIQGVMYAEISAKATQYVGTASNKIIINGVYPSAKLSPKSLAKDWQENIDQWHADIEGTVSRLTDGVCSFHISNVAKASYWQDFDCTIREHERNGTAIDE